MTHLGLGVVFMLLILSAGAGSNPVCPGEKVSFNCENAIVQWRGSAFVGECPGDNITLSVSNAGYMQCGQFATTNMIVRNSDLNADVVQSTLMFTVNRSLNATTIVCSIGTTSLLNETILVADPLGPPNWVVSSSDILSAEPGALSTRVTLRWIEPRGDSPATGYSLTFDPSLSSGCIGSPCTSMVATKEQQYIFDIGITYTVTVTAINCNNQTGTVSANLTANIEVPAAPQIVSDVRMYRQCDGRLTKIRVAWSQVNNSGDLVEVTGDGVLVDGSIQNYRAILSGNISGEITRMLLPITTDTFLHTIPETVSDRLLKLMITANNWVGFGPNAPIDSYRLINDVVVVTPVITQSGQNIEVRINCAFQPGFTDGNTCSIKYGLSQANMNLDATPGEALQVSANNNYYFEVSVSLSDPNRTIIVAGNFSTCVCNIDGLGESNSNAQTYCTSRQYSSGVMNNGGAIICSNNSFVPSRVQYNCRTNNQGFCIKCLEFPSSNMHRPACQCNDHFLECSCEGDGSEGQWMGEIPSGCISLPSPPLASHTSFSISEDGYTATYQCNSGIYELQGNSVLMFDETTGWGTSPRCPVAGWFIAIMVVLMIVLIAVPVVIVIVVLLLKKKERDEPSPEKIELKDNRDSSVDSKVEGGQAEYAQVDMSKKRKFNTEDTDQPGFYQDPSTIQHEQGPKTGDLYAVTEKKQKNTESLDAMYSVPDKNKKRNQGLTYASLDISGGGNEAPQQPAPTDYATVIN